MSMEGSYLYAVTGGQGLIGNALSQRLAEQGHRVRRLDLLPQGTQGTHPNIEDFTVDVTNTETLHNLTKDVDYIIHCAAVAGPETVVKSPTKTGLVNTLGGINVLEVAQRTEGLQRLVMLSTSEVYGEIANLNDEQDETPIGPAGEPRWMYAASKLVVDHLALSYAQEKGLPVTILRPSNVYGPGQINEGGAMKKFISQAKQNAPITVFNDGDQIRTWCYIDDMVDALLLTLSNETAIGEIFNIGNSNTVITTKELALKVKAILRSDSEIVFVENSAADIPLRIVDTKKAERMLGYTPKIGLEEGILKTAEVLL